MTKFYFGISSKNFIFYFTIFNVLTSIIAFIPIIHKIYDTKNTDNFPFIAIYLNIFSNLVLIIHSLLGKIDYPRLFLGISFTIVYIYILFIKYINFLKTGLSNGGNRINQLFDKIDQNGANIF